MPNLRIVTKNALRQASSFTASSTAGSLAVSNLVAAVKSTLHRFTGTNGSYRATWSAPARIGCVALPFCNWSSTAKQRVRVSREKSATNLQLDSERLSAWNKRGACTVVPDADVAPDGTRTMDLLLNLGTPSVADIYKANVKSLENDGTRIEPSVFIKRVSTVGTLVIQHPNGNPYGRWQVDLAKLGNAVERITRNHPAVTVSVEFTVSPNGGNGLHFFSYSLPALSVYLWGAQLELGTVSTSYAPSLDTFTSRASIGTYIGSDGLIKTAAVNEARMQYDPVNPLAPAKLLLEPAATNYAWLTAQNGFVQQSKTYRGLPFYKVAKALSSNSEYKNAGGTASVAAGTVRTASAVLRADTANTVALGFYGTSGWGTAGTFSAEVLSGPGKITINTGALYHVANLSSTEDTVVRITRLYLTDDASSLFVYPGGSGSTRAGDSVLMACVQVEDGIASYGPELVTNGAFTQDTTGWTALGGATLTVDSGRIVVTNSSAGGAGGAASQAISTVVGKVYRVSADFTKSGTAKGNIAVSNTQGRDDIGKATSAVTGKLEFTFVAAATTTHLMVYPNATDASISGSYDNISVQEEAGVELVTNGSFTTAAGWSPVGSGVAVNTSTGKLVFSSAPANSQMYQNMGAQLVQGKQYAVTYTIDTISAGSVRLIFNGANVGVSPARSTPGTYTEYITLNDATNRNLGIQAVGSATTATIDNISVREVNNLVLNGTFDADTYGWTAGIGASTLSVDNGRLKVLATSTEDGNNGTAAQAITCVVGKQYRLKADLTVGVGRLGIGMGTGPANANVYFTGYAATTRSVDVLFIATASTMYVTAASDSVDGTQYGLFDNISVSDATELVTNGTFEGSLDGWAATSAWSTSGGTAVANSAAVNTLTQAIPVQAGTYMASMDVVSASLGNVGISYNTGVGVQPSSSSPFTVLTGAGKLMRSFTFGSAGMFHLAVNSSGTPFSGAVDNITFKSVTPIPVVTSYIPTTTAAVTRAADVYTSAPGVRPDGYMDHWQSYDYDSGWVPACPAPAVELEGFTPAQAASAYAYGGGAYARHWLPQQMDATGLTVDINDPDNLQGYIEAACMVAGPVWSPKYNASATSVSVIDRTEISRSAAGDQLADPGTISRKVPIDLRAMPEADRAKFLDLVRNSRAYPVLLSVFPEHVDLALERDFTVYGRRTKDSDIAYQYAGAYSTTLEIEEI